MSETVLIVEDEIDLLDMLSYRLEKEGFKTRRAETGRDALTQVAIQPLPDLILLDLMLPDIQGTEVCRRVRTDPLTAHIPVIMVTGRDEEIDRVVGFELGAEDYVVKPYSVRELMLRVKALLRRTRQRSREEGEPIQFGELTIDLRGHRCWVGDTEVVLTRLVFRLLTTCLSRRGRVQSRERLLEDVWGSRAGTNTRTVDVHVKRLRTKIQPLGHYIQTVRGIGYRFISEEPK